MADRPRCGAKTRKGTPCQHVAGYKTQHVGVGRCKLHGGAEPHAQVNGLVALARAEQQVMGRPLAIAPEDAIVQCIQIAAGEVAYASDRISELDDSDAVAPVRRTLVRKTVDGTVYEVRQDGPQLHIWIQARRSAMDRLVGYSAAALKAGVAERLVRVAEDQAQLLARAVAGILADLGVTDHPEAPAIVRRHLTLLSQAGG